jgi:hypothetical protein
MSISRKSAMALDIVPVDTLERVFPDREPKPPVFKGPVSVPRGGKISFQFAVRSSVAGLCRMNVVEISGTGDAAFEGAATLYRVDTVHVEGNTTGSMINGPGGKRPEEWVEFLIRDATAVLASPALDLDLAPRPFVCIDFESVPDDRTGYLDCATEAATGTLSFQPHSRRRTVIPGMLSDAWTGKLRRMALRFSGGTKGFRIRQLVLADRAVGSPSFYIRSLAAGRAKLRPKRDETVIVGVKNVGGESSPVFRRSIRAVAKALDDTTALFFCRRFPNRRVRNLSPHRRYAGRRFRRMGLAALVRGVPCDLQAFL